MCHLVPLTPTVPSDAPSLGISLAPLLPSPHGPPPPHTLGSSANQRRNVIWSDTTIPLANLYSPKWSIRTTQLLTKMQIPGLHLKHTESEFREKRLENPHFNKTPSRFLAPLKFQIHCPGLGAGKFPLHKALDAHSPSPPPCSGKALELRDSPYHRWGTCAGGKPHKHAQSRPRVRPGEEGPMLVVRKRKSGMNTGAKTP